MAKITPAPTAIPIIAPTGNEEEEESLEFNPTCKAVGTVVTPFNFQI